MKTANKNMPGRNASKLKMQQDHRQIIKDLTKTLEQEPTALAYFERGFLFGCIKMYPEAIADMKASLNLDPAFNAARNALMYVKYEYAFFKKQEKIKVYLAELNEKGKLKIDKRRTRKNGDCIYSFTDKNQKKVLYNLTQDKLESYDGEQWL